MGRRLKIGVAVAACAVGMAIWSMLPRPPAQVEGYENFIYNASFTYWGSEDNLPIENVAIRFPAPNVENQTESIFLGVIWGLYWIDDENTLHLQATETTVYGLKGDRTTTLNILLGPLKEPTPDGPKLTHVVDKLYPREVFMVSCGIETPSIYVNRLTLKNFDDIEGRSSSAFFCYSPLGPLPKPVDVAFWAQLTKITSENNYMNIETFSCTVENRGEASPWLYPSLS